METQIEIQYFNRGNRIEGSSQFVNVASMHPDITDAIDLKTFIEFATDAFKIGKDILLQKWEELIGDLGSTFKDIFSAEKNYNKMFRSKIVLLAPGTFGSYTPADEARVIFRASSEDDLTTSFGRVDPGGKIIDLPERRGKVNDINYYERSFQIPLQNTPAGPYLFSFGSGDDGWKYKVGFASLLVLSIAQHRHSGFFIQSGQQRGVFDVVVPRAGGGLSYFYRGTSEPGWHGPYNFATDQGEFQSASLIQGNFGDPASGNFELVARTGDRLAHFWHVPGSAPGMWSGPTFFASGVTGNPACLQSTFGIQGHFEVVVSGAGGGLLYYRRDNDPGAQLLWSGPFKLPPVPQGPVESVALIQSSYGPPGVGQLEVIARIGRGLAHFVRLNDTSPYSWDGPHFFADGVAGTPAFIQGRHGDGPGNYEVVVPRPDGGLAHYWRNNDPGQNFAWNGPFRFGSDFGQVDSAALVQQTNDGTIGLGNLAVVARAGNRLLFFSRIDRSPWSWSTAQPFNGTLAVEARPAVPPWNQRISFFVAAHDEATHQPVDGEIFEVNVDNRRSRIGRTNVAFSHTFRTKTVRIFDRETRTWREETLFPTVTVIAPGYPDTTIF